MRRIPLLALFAVALIHPARAQETPSPTAHYALRLRADSLYAAGAWAEAGELYGRLHAASSQDGEALYRHARALFMRGDLDAAIGVADSALAMGFGDEAGSAYRLGQALARAGRDEEALAWIERAVEAGFEDRPVLKEDESFERLRANPRFRALAGFPPGDEAPRDARWREDLDFFLAEARRLHAGPDRVAWSEEFAARVERLKELVPDLTDEEVAFELYRIVVGFGDGHSVLIPIPTETVRFPPPLKVEFHFFADGLYVVRAEPPYGGLVGRRVVAIGGKSTGAILKDLEPWVSRDNPRGLEFIGPLVLRGTPFLRAMGYGDREDAAVLTIEEPGGGTRDVVVEIGGEGAPNQKLGPPGGEPTAATPRWLRRVAENYWHEALPDLDAVYLQINQIRDAEDRSIEAWAEEVRRGIEASGARHIVLDLRHNNGGNNFLNRPVVRLVVWHEEVDPGNRVWVITGPNTFSAAQNLVNALDRWTNAVFVGEPSSSKPNFAGEDTWVELPYSRLRLSISSRYWQDSVPGDDRIWVPVEVPTPLTAADYFGDRDPAMEALAEILEGG